MPSPSGKGPQKSRTAPFPVIGRAILLVAQKTVTSPRWWNDIRVYGPGQGAEQRHDCGRRRIEPANSPTPNIPAAIVDVGSRAGNGQTQNLHGGHECESVLL